MQLSEKEFKVISDTDFLLTKAQVIDKVVQLLSETRSGLKLVVNDSAFSLPNNADKITGKISKGENYQNLPYLVLDYPAYFDKENIFAFRTMFWWGNFFSCTLHLQGKFLDKYRENIIDNSNKLETEEVFVSVGGSPWQYHYGKDNYALISNKHKNHIKEATFIKLSKRIELVDWAKLPQIAKSYLSYLLEVIH